MLSLELTDQARTLLSEFDASEPLFSALRLFANSESDLLGHLHGIAAGGQAAINAATTMHSHLASARQWLPQISSRSFFKALERTAEAIGKYSSSNDGNAATAASIQERLEQFSKEYEAFLNDQSSASAVPVLRTASGLLVELETLRRTLKSTVAQLASLGTLRENEDVFSIIFPDEHELAEVAAKLNALQEIFVLVGTLIGARDAGTARILKLEYGSFLAELAVVRSILNIARPWITGLAAFYYRTQTVEGRLDSTSISSKAAIKQAFEVRQLLQKAGINTENMDAELALAGTAMAKNVAALIGKQIRFKVNGTEFSVAKAELQFETRNVPQLSPPPR